MRPAIRALFCLFLLCGVSIGLFSAFNDYRLLGIGRFFDLTSGKIREVTFFFGFPVSSKVSGRNILATNELSYKPRWVLFDSVSYPNRVNGSYETGRYVSTFEILSVSLLVMHPGESEYSARVLREALMAVERKDMGKLHELLRTIQGNREK